MTFEKFAREMLRTMAMFIDEKVKAKYRTGTFTKQFYVNIGLLTCDLSEKYEDCVKKLSLSPEYKNFVFYDTPLQKSLGFDITMKAIVKAEWFSAKVMFIFTIKGQEDVVKSQGISFNYKKMQEIAFIFSEEELFDDIYTDLRCCFADLMAKTQIAQEEAKTKKANFFLIAQNYENAQLYIKGLNINTKQLGENMSLAMIEGCPCLLDRTNQQSIPLVDEKGKALFCSRQDIPDHLYRRIKHAVENWDMDVPSLSIDQFDSWGLANAAWHIQSYRYLPTDSDGYGDEIKPDVTLRFKINRRGRLASNLHLD